MDRMTRPLGNGSYIVDADKVKCDAQGCSGEAMDRLARFENFYSDLVAGQIKTVEDMEKLRSEGKTKSVRFRELMVKKMTDSNLIDLLKFYGLE
ncbi:MAG TPA: hypothetical protein VHS59_04325 [Bacillota bacterium]|nr:hypothetical protein [Bacillota bacterium]